MLLRCLPRAWRETSAPRLWQGWPENGTAGWCRFRFLGGGTEGNSCVECFAICVLSGPRGGNGERTRVFLSVSYFTFLATQRWREECYHLYLRPDANPQLQEVYRAYSLLVLDFAFVCCPSVPSKQHVDGAGSLLSSRQFCAVGFLEHGSRIVRFCTTNYFAGGTIVWHVLCRLASTFPSRRVSPWFKKRLYLF